MLEGKSMLPKVGIGRRCGATQANVDRYRVLMSDDSYEELVVLGKDSLGQPCLRAMHIINLFVTFSFRGRNISAVS